MEWVRMLIFDKVFIICAALDFALIMGTHYLMEKNHWCVKGIALCGRYATGTGTIMSASTAWYITHPNATATEMFAAARAFVVIAGASTVIFYLIDALCDKNAAEADLRAAGLAVGD